MDSRTKWPASAPPPIPGGIGCLSQQKTGVLTLGTKKTKSRMKLNESKQQKKCFDDCRSDQWDQFVF
jgi:hypothetical protein